MRGLSPLGSTDSKASFVRSSAHLSTTSKPKLKKLRYFEPVVAVGVLVIGHVWGRIRHCFTSKTGPVRHGFRLRTLFYHHPIH